MVATISIICNFICAFIFFAEELRNIQKIDELKKKLSEKSTKLWTKSAYTETLWAYRMINFAKRGYAVTAINARTNVMELTFHDACKKDENLHFVGLTEEKSITLVGGTKGVIIIDLEKDAIITRKLEKN